MSANYRLQKRALVEEAVQDMLKNGVIRPSNSSWASTITLVQKKDFAWNIAALNAMTTKYQYPLPSRHTRYIRSGGK